MKRYFLLILAIVIVSCKKKDEHTILTGQILHVTDSSAYANTSFIIFQEAKKGFAPVKSQTDPFVTDANGSFEVRILTNGQRLTICLPNKTLVAEAKGDLFYSNGRYDFGKVYY